MPAPARRIAVFRNGVNQTIRIHREGDRLILTPVRLHRLLDLVHQWELLPPVDDFPDIDDSQPQERGALFGLKWPDSAHQHVAGHARILSMFRGEYPPIHRIPTARHSSSGASHAPTLGR